MPCVLTTLVRSRVERVASEVAAVVVAVVVAVAALEADLEAAEVVAAEVAVVALVVAAVVVLARRVGEARGGSRERRSLSKRRVMQPHIVTTEGSSDTRRLALWVVGFRKLITLISNRSCGL